VSLTIFGTFCREEVADMVRRLPSLLGFSIVTVIQPKYNYLVEVMQRSPKELVRFPHFFSYSLEKRIIPRHQVVGEANQSSRSLSSLYGCSDAVFEKKLYKWKLVSKSSK
jgi:mTERF domain-containing protein